MKSLIILICLLHLSNMMCAQIEQSPFSHNAKMIYKNNKVKEIQIYRLLGTDKILSEISKIDTNGNTIYFKIFSLAYEMHAFYNGEYADSIYYYQNGTISSISKFLYFPINALRNISKQDSGYAYVYLDNKRYAKVIDERNYSYDWSYDKSGRIIKNAVSSNISGASEASEIIYTYGKLSLPEKEIIFENYKNTVKEIQYTYFSTNNNIFEFIHYYKNNEIVETTIEYLIYSEELLQKHITLLPTGEISTKYYEYYYY